MDSFRIYIPLVVLALQFIIKLTVGRQLKTETLLVALCELPVSLIFPSVTFTIIFSSSNNDINHYGLLYLIAFIIIACIVTLIYRKCLEINDKNSRDFNIYLLLILNSLISIYCLFKSTGLLLGIN